MHAALRFGVGRLAGPKLLVADRIRSSPPGEERDGNARQDDRSEHSQEDQSDRLHAFSVILRDVRQVNGARTAIADQAAGFVALPSSQSVSDGSA